MAASMIGSDGGPEVAVIEATGWDTHANQGGSRGGLAQRLAGLDDALRALSDGMGSLWPQTAVLVVTEFGRTASVNGTRGTDHGTGGCAFLAGGAVARRPRDRRLGRVSRAKPCSTVGTSDRPWICAASSKPYSRIMSASSPKPSRPGCSPVVRTRRPYMG